jgi:hypothetical protein
MNTFRARLFSSVLLVLLASAAAVQPAIAQKAVVNIPQPAITQKPHQTIPPGKDCSNCHKGLYAEWNAGPHGVNQVQCIVCHGNVTESFTAKPPLSVCEGCHAQVAQLKSDPFMKHKTCVTCHPPHALKPHQKVVASGSKG